VNFLLAANFSEVATLIGLISHWHWLPQMQALIRRNVGGATPIRICSNDISSYRIFQLYQVYPVTISSVVVVRCHVDPLEGINRPSFFWQAVKDEGRKENL
jgi:hypothetical protein